MFRAMSDLNVSVIYVSTLLMAFLFSACQESQSIAAKKIIIENANVITMESDEIHSNYSIVIQDGVIEYVGPPDEIKYSKNARVIDATGQYIIPGLCDMHMHIDHPDILKVNLAFGVTTVMNYRGLPEHLMLREQAKKGEIFSPQIFTTGDYMEGYPATMPGFLSFADTVAARQAVIRQKNDGYDFIKVYRNLDSIMHQVICDEADKNGLTVVGHLSPDISLEQSLSAGQKVISHTEELMYFFNNENDTSRIDDLIEILRIHDISYTPNLTIFRSLPLQVEKLDSINSQEEIKYLQPALFQSWRKEFNYNHRRGEEWAKFMWDRFQFLQKVTKKIQEAGIPVLASTDAPTSGAFPGLAVHNELEELVQIGFTPFEALKSATVTPGEFINKHVNQSSRFGLIKEGYQADLILLNDNPLKQIKNTKSISGLVRNGAYFAQSDLDAELTILENIYLEIDSIVRSIEAALSDENVELAAEIYEEGKATYPDQNFLGYYTMWYEGYRYLYQNRSLTQDAERANKAVQFYKMYLKDYPNMHGSHYILGIAHKANLDTLNALASFEESMRIHPDNPYAQNQIDDLNAVVR